MSCRRLAYKAFDAESWFVLKRVNVGKGKKK
jgi:hypothetical protein